MLMPNALIFFVTSLGNSMTEMVAFVALNSLKDECNNQWKPGKYKVGIQGRYGNYIPIEL